MLKRFSSWFAPLVLVAFAALLLVRQLGGVAPTPGAFVEHLSLAEAQQRSAETGRPVFVLATADWCAPCQSLKRGAMTDPRIVELLANEFVPVYLDMTDRNDAEPQRLAAALGVESIPAMFVLQGDQRIGPVIGAVDADTLEAWLSEQRVGLRAGAD